jgi:hypothetical protein
MERSVCEPAQSQETSSARASLSVGQPTAIIVGETQATSTKLTPQEPVLFDQVHEGCPAGDPASRSTPSAPSAMRVGTSLQSGRLGWPATVKARQKDRNRNGSGTRACETVRACLVIPRPSGNTIPEALLLG